MPKYQWDNHWRLIDQKQTFCRPDAFLSPNHQHLNNEGYKLNLTTVKFGLAVNDFVGGDDLELCTSYSSSFHHQPRNP